MAHTSRSSLLCLALSVYCLLVLPRMLSHGMFLDGVAHASIARNLAENYGSFWRPYYTATVYPIFYEQPPLGFWLQSWAYRLCGEAAYVEALWGCFVGALILVGLAGIWRRLSPQGAAVSGTWFPMVLFVIMPMTSWAFSNNMLENTMSLFIVIAVYFCMVSLQNPKVLSSLSYGILSGVSIFCAVLVKGPVALFPLAVPLISMISEGKKLLRGVVTTFILVTTLVLAFGLMFSMSTASAHFFKRYWHQQVLASVTGERETSGSHFTLLKVVSRENLVPLLAAGMLTAAMYRLRQSTISTIHYRLFWYYLGIALAGSLPILISAKQKRWYAFPSLSFYSLAIAVVFNDVALALERFIGENKKRCKYITLFSSMLLCIAVFLMFLEKNALRRDKDFHRDFSEQSPIIAERSIISVYPQDLATNWSLVANIQRKFKASLSETIGHDYLLTTTEYLNSEHIPSKYKRIPSFYAKKYILFRLED
jgi:4-amino-4-deoxy-L-arabinose transferase-like glycosyltransferase